MPTILRLQDFPLSEIQTLLNRYGLSLNIIPNDASIPGSYWQAEEAGIIGLMVYARLDTPLHSILHEACHTICMDQIRRANLHTDAGGETDEEDAVCYLQIILAQQLAHMGKMRMLQDMDNWGYSFRLGSAQAWFENDADDAQAWLREHQLLTYDLQPIYQLRQ
jgi:hypothetical protein